VTPDDVIALDVNAFLNDLEELARALVFHKRPGTFPDLLPEGLKDFLLVRLVLLGLFVVQTDM
jgi:hypothetical protein